VPPYGQTLSFEGEGPGEDELPSHFDSLLLGREDYRDFWRGFTPCRTAAAYHIKQRPTGLKFSKAGVL